MQLATERERQRRQPPRHRLARAAFVGDVETGELKRTIALPKWNGAMKMPFMYCDPLGIARQLTPHTGGTTRCGPSPSPSVVRQALLSSIIIANVPLARTIRGCIERDQCGRT